MVAAPSAGLSPPIGKLSVWPPPDELPSPPRDRAPVPVSCPAPTWPELDGIPRDGSGRSGRLGRSGMLVACPAPNGNSAGIPKVAAPTSSSFVAHTGEGAGEKEACRPAASSAAAAGHSAKPWRQSSLRLCGAPTRAVDFRREAASAKMFVELVRLVEFLSRSGAVE